MTNLPEDGVPKVHPASREVLPEDPMAMHGFQVPGDPELMLRILIEEYARMGWTTDAIMNLAAEPNYRGFHGLYQLYGEDELRKRISKILAKTGVMRVTTHTKESASQEFVELNVDVP